MQGIVRKQPLDISDFAENSSRRIKELGYDTATSAGIIVAPASNWPDDDLTQLANGWIIGVISVSFHLAKFGLAPGIYDMRLSQTKFGTWEVEFLDHERAVASTTPATITATWDRYDKPYAFITFSSPGVVICTDHICIEI